MSKAAKRSRADAFGSLLGALPDLSPDARPPISAVPLQNIQIRPSQPRRHFSEGALASLVQSVREQGVLQPVLVRPVTGGYELIAGERRVRAAQLAGLTAVPAVVRDATDEQADLLAALENLQREDLNPLDEVDATLTIVARQLKIAQGEVLPLLHAQRRTPQPEVTEQLDGVFAQLGRGTWRSFASNKAGVLRFPPDLLDLMRQGTLEYTRAAALARIKDEPLRLQLTQRTLKEALSVRDIALAARPDKAVPEQIMRVRTLLDERRVGRLGLPEQGRVKALLSELEALLLGQGQRSTRAKSKRS
ncbi:ParB/RepB/Spo0J family partition protein [Deinococcus sp. QL22]|uniref:ParB/RepB/Spo0J family partition protein n=1 Tax=Deinococcus sp. QL22 TaxID=2939437 RepID=UPI002017C83A|nr:ParB/RepB/Spo0J family partition protein [Deinococcus sp. QL22]UQN08361.1 ParB/RepB/Spo0J family partition protein [Deinococcus sp. QL22]